MSGDVNKRLASSFDADERAEIERQLERIEDNRQFAQSDRSIELLEFLVKETLEGRAEGLKEYTIALAVFGKSASFEVAKNRIVSTAAVALRKRLADYYLGEGRLDPCVITIPKGGFVPEFAFKLKGEPEASSPAPQAPAEDKPAAQRRAQLKFAATGLAAVALLCVLFAYLHGRGIRITSPADGATVGPVGDVVGKGWTPGLNNYLVVEPVDQSGQRWVQARIESQDWTLSIHYGQADTPSAMRFRIYVLSTASTLPIGALTIQPQDPRASPAITVTLKK